MEALAVPLAILCARNRDRPADGPNVAAIRLSTLDDHVHAQTEPGQGLLAPKTIPMKTILKVLAAALLLLAPALATPTASAPLTVPSVIQVTDAQEKAALSTLEEAKKSLEEATEETQEAAQAAYDEALAAARSIRDEGDGNGGEMGTALYAITGDAADASLKGLGGMVSNWTKQAKDWLVDDGPGWAVRILVFLVILIIFKVLASIAGKITGKALSASKLKVSDLLKKFFIGIVSKLVFLIGVMIAFEQVGVNTGPLLAGIGVVGFVVGFALQDTLGNFASGVMILLYRPFDVGDVITAAGETGKVHDMSLVSTTMMTPDNQKLIVPNSSIWGGTIRNITALDSRRVDLVIGVGYDDDLDRAQEILMEVISSHELVFKDPAPAVKVSNLGDSSVDFVVRPWCKTSDYWDVLWDLTKTIKQRLDKEGISIPYPQRDLHLVNVPEGLKKAD